jgi:hypothetical protein
VVQTSGLGQSTLFWIHLGFLSLRPLHCIRKKELTEGHRMIWPHGLASSNRSEEAACPAASVWRNQRSRRFPLRRKNRLAMLA